MIANLANPAAEEHAEICEETRRGIVQIGRMLSDGTRVRILYYLIHEAELNVKQLCGYVQQSQPAVSHHLKLLRLAGLVEPRRDGKHNFYSIPASQRSGMIDWLFSGKTSL